MTGKKFALRGLIGLPLASCIFCIIMIVISLCRGGRELAVASDFLLGLVGGETAAFAVQFLATGLIGFVFAGASVFFENERWSLTKQTLLHFLCLSVSYMSVAWLCGWMDHSPGGVLMYVGIFLGTYVCIWLGQYLGMRKKVKKLNEELAASRK